MKKRCLLFSLFVILFSGFLSSCTTEAPPISSADVTSSPSRTSTATPAPTPSSIVVQTWQDAYAEFLREKIPISEVDFDAFIDGSDEKMRLDAFLSGGYPVTPFFYLYDIDKDEIPELISIDAANGYDAYVYTYKNNSISKMGSVIFYPFGGLGIPLDKTEGLYSDIGYKGHYGEIYFYTINNDILSGQRVLEYNNRPDLSPSQPGLPHSLDNFTRLDYYEITEANIAKVIYREAWKDVYYADTAGLLEAKASEIAAAPPEFNPYRDSESSIPLSANNRVVKAAVGDLNGDGIPDLVAVVEQAPAGRFDDRDVYVLLGKNDGTYVAAHKNRKLILRHDEGGAFGEPFEGLSIENGALTICHYGGSSSRWGYMMRFQYIKGQFALARLEYTSFSTLTANGEKTDCDFLKHTIKRYTWSDLETEPIPLYNGTLPDTVCLFDEAGFDEIASYGDIHFLPYLGSYDYHRFDEPHTLNISASEALDRIQKTCYPDMKKVYIPWTQENRDNYSKLLFYEVPDYYYEDESGKLGYFELDALVNEGGQTDFTHQVIFRPSSDGDFGFYRIDDYTGKTD